MQSRHFPAAPSPSGYRGGRAEYYEFRLLPDFAGNSPSKSITDAYLNIHYWDGLQFETGKFKQPFSYEQLVQDRYVVTMERSMLDQLVPQRDEGFMIHGHQMLGGRLEYAVAVSNGDVNDSTIDTNNNKDFNARIAMRPFNTPECWAVLRNLQFGISAGEGIEQEPVSTATTPLFLTTPATVVWFEYNNGVWANGTRTRISPELAFFYHSLGFASQYFQQEQQMRPSQTSPVIVNVPTDGYYFLFTYFLTGEDATITRTTSPRSAPGIRCARSPRRGLGNWCAAFPVCTWVTKRSRRAWLVRDVRFRDLSSPGATETTGVNWYLNKWVRAQFN